jgi:uncharacterized protein (TIGR03000 family)
MYTAVLMMALTAGADMPDGRRGGGCHGCRGGCSGGCYGGCYGGGCYGGGGCCGCYGGGGGCYGGGCYGGGCYGGGCYGGGYGGCYGGGYGGCYGGGISYGGCYGGVGAGCYGGQVIGGSVITPGTVVPGGEKLKKEPKEKGDKETMAPAPATIVVELPADAKLLIDNEATTSTGSSRVFTSPTLNPGKEYHYTLKAELVRDGKPVKAEKVVTVKAGVITPVTLTLPAASVAQR